jgi:hypothetical protein
MVNWYQPECLLKIYLVTFPTVLRIRDIFVRIRIRGSVPLTNGSGLNRDPTPDPAIFVSDLRDGKIFCLLLFDAIFTSFFKDKKHKEVTKQ